MLRSRSESLSRRRSNAGGTGPKGAVFRFRRKRSTTGADLGLARGGAEPRSGRIDRMTQSEKDEIRSRALNCYQRAIDDYKAWCGRLHEYIDAMRTIVRLHDNGSLHAFELSNGNRRIGSDNDAFGIQLPSHDDVIDSIFKCRKAKAEQDRLRARALNSGVDESTLDAIS